MLRHKVEMQVTETRAALLCLALLDVVSIGVLNTRQASFC